VPDGKALQRNSLPAAPVSRRGAKPARQHNPVMTIQSWPHSFGLGRAIGALVIGALSDAAHLALAADVTMPDPDRAAVEREASRQRVPASFLGVHWLDTRADVVRERGMPAGAASLGSLMETTLFEGRQAIIGYRFADDRMAAFSASFVGANPPERFAALQASLSKDGTFVADPPIHDSNGTKTCQHRDAGVFRIEHCVIESDAVRYGQRPRLESVVWMLLEIPPAVPGEAGGSSAP
jgi:hypothetical protein